MITTPLHHPNERSAKETPQGDLRPCWCQVVLHDLAYLAKVAQAITEDRSNAEGLALATLLALQSSSPQPHGDGTDRTYARREMLRQGVRVLDRLLHSEPVDKAGMLVRPLAHFIPTIGDPNEPQQG